MTESKDRLIALTAKELAATVSTHGPIDVDHTTSAAKRVVGGVLSHVKHVRASTATRLIDLRQQNRRLVEQQDQLRADLERVTAERDAMREVCDLAPDALVILAGLHLGTTWELSPYVKDELARVTPLVRDALARLDARRKATEGK